METHKRQPGPVTPQGMTGLFLVAAAVLLVAIALSRSVYTWLVPDAIDRDAYAHMLYVRDIKANGHRIPDHPRQVETSGTYAYPFLLHWLLSFFPLGWLRTIDRYFSPISDVAFGLLFLALLPLGVGDRWLVLFGLTVFLVTPQFLRPDLPNAIGLSSRKPGLLLATASLLAFTTGLNDGSGALLVLALLTGAMVFLSSKFSVQALLLVSLGLATVSVLALGYVVAAALLAVVLSGGAYLAVARSHVAHLYEYALIKQHKIFEPVRLSPLGIARDVEDLDDVFRALYNNRLVRPLVNNPFAIAVGVTAVAQVGTDRNLAVPGVYWVWIGACVAGFVITSLPYMLFLGKAERYLEYAFLPAVVVLGAGVRTFGPWYDILVGCLLASGVGVVAVYVWAYPRFFFSASDERRWDELTAALGKFEPTTVLVQPFYGARRIAWATDHSVVDFVMNEGTTPNAESDALCPNTYAILTGDTEWLAEQYDPELAVFDTGKRGEIEAADGLSPPATEPLFANDRFEVYRFANTRG